MASSDLITARSRLQVTLTERERCGLVGLGVSFVAVSSTCHVQSWEKTAEFENATATSPLLPLPAAQTHHSFLSLSLSPSPSSSLVFEWLRVYMSVRASTHKDAFKFHFLGLWLPLQTWQRGRPDRNHWECCCAGCGGTRKLCFNLERDDPALRLYLYSLLVLVFSCLLK